MRELREEAGLAAQDVTYIGTRIHRTDASYQPFGATERHFLFFEFTATATSATASSTAAAGGGDRSALRRNKRRTEDLGLKDFYNASSWVRPANIAAHMQHVDQQAGSVLSTVTAALGAVSLSGAAVDGGFSAVQRNSKFFTLRKFCLPADVTAVLDASEGSAPLEVDAQDQAMFESIRAKMAAAPTGGSASFERFGGGHKSHHLPAPPTGSTAAAAGSAPPAAGGNNRWNSGGAGAYRPPAGNANDSNSFRNFAGKPPAAPAAPTKPVSSAADKSFKCDNCGSVFTLTASNQLYYADKGFALPKKCEKCRAAKKVGGK